MQVADLEQVDFVDFVALTKRIAEVNLSLLTESEKFRTVTWDFHRFLINYRTAVSRLQIELPRENVVIWSPLLSTQIGNAMVQAGYCSDLPTNDSRYVRIAPSNDTQQKDGRSAPFRAEDYEPYVDKRLADNGLMRNDIAHQDRQKYISYWVEAFKPSYISLLSEKIFLSKIYSAAFFGPDAVSERFGESLSEVVVDLPHLNLQLKLDLVGLIAERLFSGLLRLSFDPTREFPYMFPP